MVHSILIAVLISSIPAAASESVCAPANGIESVLNRGQVVLLGEIHGTEEAPEFVATVACHALARDLEVTIALELPQSEEPAVRDPNSSVVELPFWAKDYQDGRTSEAMLRLIERVRGWKEDGGSVDVVLLDDPTNFQRRDERMADRLLEAVAASPDRFFVALTGNIHNRTSAGSGRMGERVSSALGGDRVTSLNMTHAGGTAWICEATQGCGPLTLGERPAEPAGQVTLLPTPDSRGYNGTYSTGTISASPPAKDAGRD